MALQPFQAGAWGLAGNLIVTEITENHLDPRTRTAIEELLAPEGLHDLTDLAGWQTTWLNQHPDDKDWFEDKIPFASNGTFRIDLVCRDDRCLSRQLARFSAILSKAGDPEQKREALKFVVAMTAALWQPMNCIDNADDNGRKVEVKYRSGPNQAEENTNLHELWDSVIIAQNFDVGREERNEPALAEKIRGKIGKIDDSTGIAQPPQLPLRSPPSTGPVSTKAAISIQRASSTCATFGGPDLPMSLSPYVIGRDIAYRGVASPGHPSPDHSVTLPANYGETAWPTIRRLLRNAGMDLALRLNEALAH